MKKDIGIANWQFCGVKNIAISVNEVEVDGEIRYNPVLSIFLETFDESDEEKVIILATDNLCTSAKGSVYATATQLTQMFKTISAKVNHFDESCEIVSEYDLNEDFAEFEEYD